MWGRDMRVIDRLQESGMADDYTPATDLVFSMLALTLLLLAIFGAGSHVTEGTSRVALEHRQSEIGALEVGRDALVKEKDGLAAKLVKAEDRIHLLEADLARRAPPKGEPTDVVREKLMRALGVAEQQYAEKTRQYEAIMDELKAAQRLNHAEVRLPPLDAETWGTFVGSDDHVSPALLAEVVRGLKSIRGQVSEFQLNEVVLSIETGFVPGRGTAAIPDEESLETLLVGSALQRELWRTSLPPACVVVQPLGSVRASGLVDRMVMPGAGPLMESLIKKGGALDGPALKQRAERLIGKDKRIVVAVIVSHEVV